MTGPCKLGVVLNPNKIYTHRLVFTGAEGDEGICERWWLG